MQQQTIGFFNCRQQNKMPIADLRKRKASIPNKQKNCKDFGHRIQNYIFNWQRQRNTFCTNKRSKQRIDDTMYANEDFNEIIKDNWRWYYSGAAFLQINRRYIKIISRWKSWFLFLYIILCNQVILKFNYEWN